MTNPTNWPNPERPGVPMFPERDGLHVVMGPYDRTPVLVLWRSRTNDYLKGEIRFTPEEVLDARIAYGGPHLTATQIDELLAGERFDLGVINSTLEEMRPKNDRSDWTEYAHTKSDFVDEAKKRFREIRNLGAAP